MTQDPPTPRFSELTLKGKIETVVGLYGLCLLTPWALAWWVQRINDVLWAISQRQDTILYELFLDYIPPMGASLGLLILVGLPVVWLKKLFYPDLPLKRVVYTQLWLGLALLIGLLVLTVKYKHHKLLQAGYTECLWHHKKVKPEGASHRWAPPDVYVLDKRDCDVTYEELGLLPGGETPLPPAPGEGYRIMNWKTPPADEPNDGQ